MTNQPLEPETTSQAQTPATPAQSKGKRGGGGGKAGRPSLSGSEKGGKTSPQIAFRVNPTLRQKAQQVAEGEGMNVSQLGRKALKEYLAKK
jgi:hypothetical protein